MYGLEDRYDEVILADARDITLPEAELYIFGDVLEHMPAQDAMALWDRARQVSSWLVINLPVRRYEQGAAVRQPARGPRLPLGHGVRAGPVRGDRLQ